MSGKELIHCLKALGYSITKQHGSHIKLTTTLNGEHHITIPDHHSLKLGTLHGILVDLAAYHQMDKLEVLRTVFRVS